MQNLTRDTLISLIKDDSRMRTVTTTLKETAETKRKKQKLKIKQMQTELDYYRQKHEESRNLNMELKILRDDLKTTKHQSTCYREKVVTLEEQLDAITKDKNAIQSEHLICKRELLSEVHTLRANLNKAKSELASQDNTRIREIQALHREVEGLTKINDDMDSKLKKTANQRWEISQKNEIIKLQAKKYSELEERLDRAMKENEHYKAVVIRECKHRNADLCKENQDLKNSLYSKTQQLADKSRKLEEKDHIIEEKEKECQKLKDSMSRMLPPEKAELIPRLQWTIREQSDKIKAITAQSKMFQVQAEECKAELEKAIDREETNKKLYLEEKKRNYDLMEALRPVSQGRSGKAKLPPIVNAPHMQSREKVTPQKRKAKTVVLKPEEEPVLPPVTNTRNPISSPLGQRFNLLPPLPNKYPRLQSAQHQRFFLTQQHGYTS